MRFADFIAPLDPEVFRAEYFGRTPIHIHRVGRARPDIFDWAGFNRALAVGPYWTEDSLKVYMHGRAALRDSYCDSAEGRAKAPVNAAKVRGLIGAGASLVANYVHHIAPSLRAVTDLLEQEFAAKTFANVYCSFKNVQAFKTHYDLHDVFAFQAEGEKVWKVYEARADAPVSPIPPGDEAEKWIMQTRGRLLFEAHMKPGDVLYLPRGQYHDALTNADTSLHVTFGVAPATGLALFKLLETALTGENAFRTYLPDARNEAKLREQLAALAQRVSALMTSHSFATDVLNHQRSLAASPAAAYDLPAQHKATWFQVVKPAQVVRRDASYAVAFEGGEFALKSANPTAEWILQQRTFSLADASTRQPGLNREEFSAVLERLLAAGVIVQLEMR